ncbi:MAG: transcriptional repressor [Acidobacteriota bacterium]
MRHDENTTLRERLGTLGGHMTRQRSAVYSYLCEGRQHPTAEEVYLGVKRELPRISLATVYKNLESLVNCGLATKVTAGDGAARYDIRTDHHYHSRCLKCGAMVDLEPEAEGALPELVRIPDAFEVTQYRVEVLGFCASCRNKQG